MTGKEGSVLRVGLQCQASLHFNCVHYIIYYYFFKADADYMSPKYLLSAFARVPSSPMRDCVASACTDLLAFVFLPVLLTCAGILGLLLLPWSALLQTPPSHLSSALQTSVPETSRASLLLVFGAVRRVTISTVRHVSAGAHSEGLCSWEGG